MTRTAIVFGAKTEGNGKGVADRLNADGYKVVALCHQDGLRKPKEADDGTVTVDMSSTEALIQASSILAKHKAASLVYADIFFAMEDPEAFNYDEWNKSVAINMSAPNLLFRELVGSMPDGSSYVVVTSTEGFVGSFGASAYAATKAGIHNLVKSLANISGGRGIRVNAVAAGWIGGVMDTDEVFDMSRAITPLGRLGTTAEIGAVAAFLLSDEASFVNGSVIVADGGYSGVDTIAKYEFEQSRANGSNS